MSKLPQNEIDERLTSVPEWSQANDRIQRTCMFDSFDDAVAFVNRVAQLAEAQQHHPDILIRFNKVTLTLSTHDAGGITAKDFELAISVDELFAVSTR